MSEEQWKREKAFGVWVAKSFQVFVNNNILNNASKWVTLQYDIHWDLIEMVVEKERALKRKQEAKNVLPRRFKTHLISKVRCITTITPGHKNVRRDYTKM